jgi:hypothetical protein
MACDARAARGGPWLAAHHSRRSIANSYYMGATKWKRQPNKVLGYVVTSIVTLDMTWSLGLLVAALPSHTESPQDLLRSASALWITDILVFASWYWRLDAAGPRARELRAASAPMEPFCFLE